MRKKPSLGQQVADLVADDIKIGYHKGNGLLIRIRHHVDEFFKQYEAERARESRNPTESAEM